MYHRIAAVESDPWRLAVAPNRFEEQMRLLRERFSPIALRDLVAARESGTLPRGSVAVTFDDGYRDNLKAAKPLLARHDVPGTVFVISRYVGSTRDFWWDELDDLCRLPTAVAAGLDYRATWERLRPLPMDTRLAELDALWATIGGEPHAATSVLGADELVELAAGRLVEVGAHTATHPVLPWLGRSAQLEEIRSGKAALEQMLGRPVTTFSYPHGEYDEVSPGCALEAGLSCACTTRPEAVTSQTDPFRIPRLFVGNWPAGELEARLERLLR
jgi:peptidoglycan/xylan/chitin deacetylase (PgdA/CDA1 family)